jgi:hypothetical protein
VSHASIGIDVLYSWIWTPALKNLASSQSLAAGRREAEAAIADGALECRINGILDQLTCEQAAALLNDRFGIRVRLDRHSIVQNAALDVGFNERMAEGFARRFGRDVVAEVFREVERTRKRQR